MLRHAQDIPTRAGLNGHGVFDIGRVGVLKLLDEAWSIAQKGGAAVRSVVQGNRTVYTIDMGRRVGFVGGVAGAAAGNPATNFIQLIVQNGNEVISAFPVIPWANEANMFYVSTTCPACSAGAVGFRRCSDEQTIVLLCDECNAVWTSPDEVSLETVVFPQAPSYVVSGLGVSIAKPASRWASADEIERAGWRHSVAGEGKALDEQ